MANVVHVSEKKLADAVGAEASTRANAISAEYRRAKSAEDALGAAVETKVDKVAGKGLSESDFTAAEKSKLEGIEAGAQVNPVPIDPSVATTQGDFADAKLTLDLINDAASVNSAHYLTADASGTPFATASELRSALATHTQSDPKFFYAGSPFTPTKNDWVVVQADEEHPLGTIVPSSRWGFVGVFGGGGSFQFQVSYRLPLTTGQIAALNSGITGAIVNWLLSFRGGDRATTLDFITNALNNRLKLSGGVLTGGLEIKAPEGLTLGRSHEQQLRIDAFEFTVMPADGELIVLSIPLQSGTLALQSDIPDVSIKLDKEDVIPQSEVTEQTPSGKAADAKDLKPIFDRKRNKNDYSAVSFSVVTFEGADYTDWEISAASGRLVLSVVIDGMRQNVALFNSQTGVFTNAATTNLAFDGKAPVANVWPTVKDALVRASEVPAPVEVIDPASATAAGKAADALATKTALAGKVDKVGTDGIRITDQTKDFSISNPAGMDFTRFQMGGIVRSNRGGQADLSLRLGRSGYFAVEEYTLPDNTQEYDNSATYAVGAFVRREGALFVCKTAITTAEAWTPAHWTAMPGVSALFSSANSALMTAIENKVDSMFDNGETEEF